MIQEKLLPLFITSVASSLIFSYFSIQFAKKVGFWDLPNIEKHKIHQKPVPLAGGISLFLCLLIITICYTDLFSSLVNGYVIAGFVFVFLTGLLDDRFIFLPVTKLLGQLIGATLIFLGGYSTHLFGDGILDWFITIFWFTGVMNAFNFLDGSDGMILETGIVIAGALILFTQLSAQFALQTLAIAFVGILLGLLFFNAMPAKMFMGDSGSQVLGLMLAILTLQYNPLGHDNTSSWITPIIMMALPIFDVSLVVISRLRRKLPVYRSGLDHSFHRLVQSGFSPQKANLILISSVLATNAIAFAALKANRFIAYAIFLSLLIGGYLIIRRVDHNYEPEMHPISD